MNKTAEEFLKFKDIIAKLRDPNGGCPWDLKQTHESLKPYLLEEVYEVLEAIDTKPDKICEELGDVLLQVFLHSQIASESKNFDITDVIKAISDKIVERHPHVFGSVIVKTAEEVKENWEKIKNKDLNKSESILDSVPAPLPALAKAQRMGEKAAVVGFDWKEAKDVISKIQEEIEEFHAEKKGSKEATEEFGDLLFALTQFARKSGINAEDALNQSCYKFKERFKKVEKMAGPKIKDMSLDKLEELWQSVKISAGN